MTLTDGRTHIQKTVSRRFAVLRQLLKIRRPVPQPTFQSLVVTLVNSRPDYGNGALIGHPAYLMRCLQSFLIAAARLIFNLRRSDHVSDALIGLHWLRVPERIRSNLAVLAYKVLHGCASRTLARSSTLPTFQVAKCFALLAATVSSNFRFTAPLLATVHFRLLAPGVPPEVTSAPSLTTVRTRLKTFLFTESYPDIRLI